MQAFDTNLISQIANKLYNQSFPVTIENSIPTISEIPTNPIHSGFETTPSLEGVVPNFPTQEIQLEKIQEIFYKIGNGRVNSSTDKVVQTTNEPLSKHSNRLVQDQLYTDTHQKPAGDLKTFVNQIQSGKSSSNQGIFGIDSNNCVLLQGLNDHKRLSENSSLSHHVSLDANQIRKDFPVLNQKIHGKQLVWLDNAATTQKPYSVIQAISDFYSHDNSNIHRGAHTLAARSTDAFENARKKVQNFLKAGSPEEIVFVRGTTEAINLVAQTYGRKFLQPGDEIILSVLEHHANIVPWQIVAKEKGAIIRVIPVNDNGEVILEHFESLLGPRTKFVSLAHANNSLGTILPIAQMIQMSKRYGARVLIDAAQSVAHIPIHVKELDCDFLVFSGHKIFGPTGIGALYGKREVLEIMPPWQGGGNMIKNVTFEETTYNDIPAKFEAGTPNVADAVGLGVALDYVNRLGLENISKYEHQLLVYATSQMKQIKGLRIIGNAREKVGVLSFVLQNRNNEEVGKLLDQQGIAVRAGHHCAQPSLRRFGLESTVRPSLSLYNTKEDIDRLVEALERITASR
jgi:cysteine desulfurase / selenocysteine lyase